MTLFLFLFIVTATLIALKLQQEHIRIVYSNKEARKRPTESNGTPAMDLDSEPIILVGIVVRACILIALSFKMLFLRSFVKKGLLRDYFT